MWHHPAASTAIPDSPDGKKPMITKRKSTTEISPRKPAAGSDVAPPNTPTRAASVPPPVSFTYGSWMELGLAARQMMAASEPRDAVATRGSRRR